MNASCFFSAATRNRARPISMNYFVSPRRTKVKVLAALRIKRPEKKRAKEGEEEREWERKKPATKRRRSISVLVI